MKNSMMYNPCTFFDKGDGMQTFDDINGQVVGGDYGQCWVTYEGRKQGKTMYANDYPEADAACWTVINRLQNELGENFRSIFPNDKGWKFHFDGI